MQRTREEVTTRSQRALVCGRYVHLGKTEQGQALFRSLPNLLSAVGTAQLAGTVWTPGSGKY